MWRWGRVHTKFWQPTSAYYDQGADYAYHICYTDANILCSFDIAFVLKLDTDKAIMFTQARFI